MRVAIEEAVKAAEALGYAAVWANDIARKWGIEDALLKTLHLNELPID